MTTTEVRVLGVDGYQRGWVGIGWDGSSVAAYVGPTITELVQAVGAVDVVAIDIPIGLPASGRRQADIAVKTLLGVRRSTVFFTPVRAAIERETFAEANAAARFRGGFGLSQQAYALRAKLLDVDAWVRTAPVVVREIHPEVSFAEMAGRPLLSNKHTWRGMHERRALLRREGIELADDLGAAGTAGVDDVLDAAAACWSARRIAAGQARSFPDPPEPLDGVAAAIWA